MSDNDIASGMFYPIPLHKQKAFNDSNCRVSGQFLPIAELVASQSVCLPIFPEMTNEQVDYVIEKVNQFYEDKISG